MEEDNKLSEKMQKTIDSINENYLIQCDLEAIELGVI